jgi:hypothetical protein
MFKLHDALICLTCFRSALLVYKWNFLLQIFSKMFSSISKNWLYHNKLTTTLDWQKNFSSYHPLYGGLYVFTFKWPILHGLLLLVDSKGCIKFRFTEELSPLLSPDEHIWWSSKQDYYSFQKNFLYWAAFMLALQFSFLIVWLFNPVERCVRVLPSLDPHQNPLEVFLSLHDKGRSEHPTLEPFLPSRVSLSSKVLATDTLQQDARGIIWCQARPKQTRLELQPQPVSTATLCPFLNWL